jgi:tetratricopeptide (TPR) repeat protein
LLLAAAWKLRRSRPLISFGLFWIPVTLLPFSGIVALKNLQAERYLYAPSAGFCVAVAAGLAEAARASGRAARVLGAVLLALFAAWTLRRNRDYRDDLSFFAATNAVDDGIPRVHFNLAQAYAYAGDDARAEAEYRRGAALWPDALQGRLRYARFLAARGRRAQALSELEELARRHPGHPLVASAVGEACAGLKTPRRPCYDPAVRKREEVR